MRFTDDQAMIGDILNFVLKCVPTYPLASSIYCDAQCEELSKKRADSKYNGNGFAISPDLWAIENNGSDVIVMFIHMIFWSLILMIIELGWLDRRPKKPVLGFQKLQDEDVKNEEFRV